MSYQVKYRLPRVPAACGYFTDEKHRSGKPADIRLSFLCPVVATPILGARPHGEEQISIFAGEPAFRLWPHYFAIWRGGSATCSVSILREGALGRELWHKDGKVH
jgi:hypothetical protein